MLLLDSADPAEVARAVGGGLATGVTTNPALVAAQAPRRPLDVLRAVLAACGGPVFYQPSAPRLDDAEREAGAAVELAPGQVVVKLPAAADHVALAHRLVGRGVPVALTAVYAPAQALVAASVGCAWVIPYVDRARRLAPDSPPIVPALASVLAGALAREGSPRILAASVKTPAQAVEAVTAGAHAVTAPLAVLAELAHHPLSDSAIAEFAAAACAGEVPAGGRGGIGKRPPG